MPITDVHVNIDEPTMGAMMRADTSSRVIKANPAANELKM